MNADWHPDAELLADVAEGLADPDTAARAERHLASCADCRVRQAELESVTVVLRSQATPRIPDQVAARIAAALAAEPMPVAASGGSVTALPIDARRRGARRLLRQGLAAAAAVAAVAVVGTAGVSIFRDNGVGESTSTAGAAAERTTDDLAAGPGGAAAPPRAPVTATGRDYTSANLAAAARELTTVLRASPTTASRVPALPAPGDAEGGVVAEAPALSRLSDPIVLAGCLGSLSGGRQSTALAVDLATYEGRPAAIVVLPNSTPGHVQVFVVGPNCSASATDLITATSVRR